MKQITILFLTLIGLPAFGQTANELNEQSKLLLQTGEFEEGIPLLEQASELGNAEAQYNLGSLLSDKN